jgi:hypothetical protein
MGVFTWEMGVFDGENGVLRVLGVFLRCFYIGNGCF